MYEQLEIFVHTKNSCVATMMDKSDLDVSEDTDTDDFEEKDSTKYQDILIHNYWFPFEKNSKKIALYTTVEKQITPFNSVFSPPPEKF